ncbi:MAG: 23S rRNA pseudouridine(1911/1915/1917) synthase RluD [Gammaproteobacteria bacterium]|nr:23S rRNA pseudouridine(1911/1915/1917) synthase RluD [Gammaproteobacteria bacterium]
MPTEKLSFIVTKELSGKRLDQALSQLCPQHSRARLQNWIKQGFVQLDNANCRPRDPVSTGQHIDLDAELPEALAFEAENISLDVIYEDKEILVINKPAGLVVHPGAGNPDHTLLNALLYYRPELKHVPRAGIVHRLDKDTSGLMVVALTPIAHSYLVEQLRLHLVKRQYQAIVQGVMTAGGTVDAAISRHHIHRKRMAVKDSGKFAITHYRILKKYPAHTHIQVQLETGRTHQIRVHMAHIKYPIVGDKVYGGRARQARQNSQHLRELIIAFPRQALHASELNLKHPVTDDLLEFSVAAPEDFLSLLTALDND